MRRATVTAALILGTFAAAAPAAAQPACGDVITQDTTLEADLSCGDDALIVGADGITLDLGGHSVYSSHEAISNEGFDDVTIQNGSVNSSGETVSLVGATGNIVRDLDVQASVWGIVLRDSDDNRIVRNDLISAVLRVGEGSDRNVVRENVVRGFQGLISLTQATENRLVRNIGWGPRTPISLYQSHRNSLRENALITVGSGHSLHVLESDDNLVVGNALVHLEGNDYPAVQMETSSRNRFRANDFAGVSSGVLVISGADSVFVGNDLAGQPLSGVGFEPDGLRLRDAATGTILRDNSVAGFEDDGIDAEAPGTLIRRNAANDNGDLGIEAVAGVTDGGGNTAVGNGNPAQCAGVACAP